MFNPAVFSKTDIDTLRTLSQPLEVGVGFGRAPRTSGGSSTDSQKENCEQKTTRFCEKCAMFQRTGATVTAVQQQVEGELFLKLRSGTDIRVIRQKTSTIKEDILLAAEGTRVNQDELRTMCNVAKHINFNDVQRSIHFHFFDRATARKYELVIVLFKGAVYRLANMHQPDTGSVWARQLGSDGMRIATQLEYDVELHNVTRFTDIGRLTAYFEKYIAAEFELEDLDTCTPNSWTSNVWKVTVKMARCPEFLRGIVRIIWYRRTIILKHPEVGRQLQCLHCGNLGHTMARCRYNDAQLHGQGSRVATEQEVAALDDLATPFTSLAEIKQVAAQRLQLQMDNERKAQEAVAPAPSAERQ
ncbi:unnamed protein product [Peronospora destructor]|uniref:CCHC-type domain-containing protein n=1 Tax=Peronospora destructor TaxID=86335 RepID=A0AAV0T4B0_9STRA|nr:unnamed protein product [Peronospora destructor]